MNEFVFHGAVVLMAIVILFVIFYTAWQGLVVDIVRQRAFEVRDSALLWAVDHGKIDSDEYKDFREAINTSIRYYEDMSLPKIFAMMYFSSRIKNEGRKISRRAFMADEHLKSEFTALASSMTIGLILRSFVGMAAFITLIPVVMISYILNGRAKKSTKEIAYRLQNEVQTDILFAA